ncbi:SpoIIE family protein phosphatase [Streptomyces sp. 15-116A]|uniref:PP2C family protein-serine/threonine phosphatase n=1 Tax=Streptomyces sp. 15-116A TaxID=2259035 RepID=UPI0021B49691|nr:SpoIIE family protein phosphatase [Streptomyces sp. 15-116A]MCT7351984.1 SpoIIE family protein phosphatase [Streptomyces sp. 15-116A]
MSEPVIDYEAVYQSLPGMVALLTPELVYADVNAAYERGSGHSSADLVGRFVFDVFPDNPNDPEVTGARSLRTSLLRVLATGERDSMPLQRYDVEDPHEPGVWRERYWSTVNTPLLDTEGKVVLIVHRVEEVTELIRARGTPEPGRTEVMEADLYTRARELQELNDRLRRAHAEEREVALSLQEAMLPARRQVRHQGTAVRYRPAAGSLNVCGDWYDMVDLVDGHRIGVSVGDVVGHGLEAAGVMGQLRSALSAASRVAAGPSEALNVVGRYAHVVDGAESATVVTTFIDFDAHTIRYSSAGHPPPVLVHPDGRVEFLDRATDPPLDARPDPRPRPEAATTFTPGATLVLYTDGLIERRREDIDVGLRRLAEAVCRHRTRDPEPLADIVLQELLPPGGATDDTALVVVRL